MGCPVSSYFYKSEICLGVNETYHRNTPKNCGEYKLSANYGPTTYLTNESGIKDGTSQLIWTYDEMLLESGASNILFVIKDNEGKKLVTHPVDGLILEGNTRAAILQLARDVDPDIKVEERPIKINELIDRHKKGEVLEVFMSGTAAVITSADKIKVREQDLLFPRDDNREFSTKMNELLFKIQRGKIPSPLVDVIKY